MERTLKSCPFCGSIPNTAVNSRGGYLVGCFTCTADGPTKSTVDEAVFAWNSQVPASVEVAEYVVANEDSQALREITRLVLRERHDAMGSSEGTLSERLRRFAADMRGDGADRREGEYAIYADAIAEFAREAREVEMAAHSALDDGTEGEEEDYPNALAKAEVKKIALAARCRFDGADFAPNGLHVLALRESRGGDIALCHDEETACILSEALTAYFGD